MPIILAVLGGGGTTALINYFATRKKESNSIDNTNIDASLKLRDTAIKSLMTTEEKLEECQKLLDDARIELLIYKSYVIVLCDILEKNGIKYTSYEQYHEKKIREFLKK